jgi:hypothetical protein
MYSTIAIHSSPAVDDQSIGLGIGAFDGGFGSYVIDHPLPIEVFVAAV